MLKEIFSSNSAKASLEAADAARDSGDWKRARERYEDFLKADPSRYDIWVQLGHSRKESGDLSGAEAAYRHSLVLNDSEADTYLQLGHVLKIQDRADEAIEAYGRALELDPRMPAARRELRALGVSAAPAPAHSKRLLVDLSDVFFYLRHHSTVSGIQRVQLGLAKALIELHDMKVDVAFLTERFDHSGYVEVEPKLISGLIRVLKKSDVNLSELQRLGEQAASDGDDYEPVKGDVLLVLGAFWVLPDIIGRIISLKSFGVRVGVMIHDIIPITHPEYCEKALTDTFNLYIKSTLKVVDIIISISEYTQDEVKKLLGKEGIPLPEMFVLHNAHVSWDVGAPNGKGKTSPEIDAIIEQPYVLYVSTIEVRKNHTLLFRVWKQLIAEFGEKTPQLVFLGRPGWRVRDLMDQITGTDYLGGRISILHDIPDADLETLYRHALFTTFPSFVEGWGLPVGESLIFGRPCLASNSSSVPEVGGEFVDYFDPNDVAAATAAFRKMISDRNYLAARAKAIATRFKPRTWADAATELLTKTSKLLSAPVNDMKQLAESLIPPLAAGKTHQIGHKDDRSKYITEGLGTIVHFLFDNQWYPVENFGRWLKGGVGSIRFKTPTGVAGPLRIILGLSTTGWQEGLQIQISVGKKHAFKPVALQAGADFDVVIEADVEGPIIEIKLSIRGEIAAGPDPRKGLCVGVRTISYAGANDLEARLSLIEEAMASRPDVVKLSAPFKSPAL